MVQWLELVFKLPLFQSFFYRIPEPSGIPKPAAASEQPAETSFIGKRAAARFGSQKLTGFIIGEYNELPAACPLSKSVIKPVDRIIDSEPLFAEEHISFARWISRFYICSEGEALSAMLPSGRREIHSLHTAALELQEETVSAAPLHLSAEQEAAAAAIAHCTDSTFFYVYGITGSGKTEVFLQAAEHILAQGKSVLYLVPEIALSRQVSETVLQRFGNRCAMLHSGLSGSKRLSEWRRIQRGEATIVVGVRSAIFAPVEKLGLIIIDEEHDGSYKSGFAPRYHARQAAMYLCKKHNCPLVMGSATPSVEAWYMMQKGVFRRLTLTKRLSGGALPAIRVESLMNTHGALSDSLLEAMKQTKQQGKQSIVFLNRRGFSHFFKCKNCGHELLCKNCSVPLTLHKSENMMKCHYCGWKTAPVSACPECGSLEAGYTGIGTEYIEEQVRKAFPDCTIERIDTDVLQKNKQAAEILTAFREGKTDILLGTQMIAKGLNFPRVKLVGIALADTGLQMPDFRAAERTFALIMQVAGRAGRYVPDGEVIIQTYNPQHPAIVCAVQHQAAAFYTQELRQRQLLEFPPFTRLIRLVFRSKDYQKAEAAASGAATLLQPLLQHCCANGQAAETEVLGPSECMLSLIAGNYRMQLLLRSRDFAPMQQAVYRFITGYKAPNGVYIEVDVDPVHLL